MFGKFNAGSANVPPIAGPIIVPTDQTKGIMEYALAIQISICPPLIQIAELTFMFRLRNQLRDHRLNHTHITIQESPNCSPSQSETYIRRKAHHNQTHNRPQTSRKQYRFSPNSIRQSTPEHASQGFRKCERRDEKASIEGRIFFVSDMKLLDEWPGIRKD